MTEINDLLLELLTLKANGGEIVGRTRLQKLIFLLKHKFDIPFNLAFIPYYYGPYSEQLALDLELLKATNMITEETESFSEGLLRYRYKLSEDISEWLDHEIANNSIIGEIYEKISTAVKNELIDKPTNVLISEAKKLMEILQKQRLNAVSSET